MKSRVFYFKRRQSDLRDSYREDEDLPDFSARVLPLKYFSLKCLLNSRFFLSQAWPSDLESTVFSVSLLESDALPFASNSIALSRASDLRLLCACLVPEFAFVSQCCSYLFRNLLFPLFLRSCSSHFPFHMSLVVLRRLFLLFCVWPLIACVSLCFPLSSVRLLLLVLHRLLLL